MSAPRFWSQAELVEQAQIALDEFVDRRLAEPEGTYATHFRARRKALVRLFRKLSQVDPNNPSAALVREVIADEELFAALRYVAGPPVSEDDLGVLVTRDINGIAKTNLLASNDLPVAILKLICKLSDPFRFPWLTEGRAPTMRELREAVAMTSALHASQSLQTERRGYGRAVEQRLVSLLVAMGYVQVKGAKSKANPKPGQPVTPAFPPSGRVTQPSHHPVFPNFYGECIVYGRKVDLFIALRSGKMVALEAKDSSSALNGTKRLLNDTAAKAKAYNRAAGTNVISVALLSGVFKIADLVTAQSSGLHLVWAHDLDEFIEWIGSQK
jgi:XamI restriction endonuclease